MRDPIILALKSQVSQNRPHLANTDHHMLYSSSESWCCHDNSHHVSGQFNISVFVKNIWCRRKFRLKNFKMAVKALISTSEWNHYTCNNSKSPCCPDASHLVSFEFDIQYRRCHLKNDIHGSYLAF